MKNYLIYVIAAICLSVLLVFVLVVPTYQNLNILDAEALEKETTLEFQTSYFEELQNIEDRLENTETLFDKIKSAIPEGNDLPNLMNYFQNSASRSGMMIRSMSPSLVSSDQERRIKSSRVNMTLTGSYEDFKRFIDIIEKSSRLIEVEKISFQSPVEDDEPFQFNISTKVYYR